MSPEGPDWAMLSRQLVEMHRGSEIYRRGQVDGTMPDGSGLWMAADGILGRELIWREEGFIVGKLDRPVAGIQPRVDAGTCHASGSQGEPRITGDRS